jgi:actin related protein 2/3 complex subunit 3
VLFRNFEVKGPADRVLIYLTLYISACLQKLPNQAKGNAEKALYQLAIENFSLPGDKAFALGGIVTNPANRQETGLQNSFHPNLFLNDSVSDTMRQYFTQLRQETGLRLVSKVYQNGDAVPDKWWMCFLKRKFLNKTL